MTPEPPDPNEPTPCWIAAMSLVAWVLFILVIYLLGQAFAATINLSWTANPPEQNVLGYRVYRTSPEPRTMLVDTTSTSATVTVNDDDVLVLTAYNSGGESADSPPIVVRLTPQEPHQRVTLQISSDLQTWTDWSSFDVATREGNFFRLKLEPKP
jgi:hypothetical protein